MSQLDRNSPIRIIKAIASIFIVLFVLSFFPQHHVVREKAKQTQAKNDLSNIVTALKAFYTEYGAYPATGSKPVYFGDSGNAPPDVMTVSDNSLLFDVLQDNTSGANASTVAALNPRNIAFMNIPTIRDTKDPRGGVMPNGSPGAGTYFDPWGSPYNVQIDPTGKNELRNPYLDNPSGKIIHGYVVAWALGKNRVLGGGPAAKGFFSGETGTANRYSKSGDVISWQ